MMSSRAGFLPLFEAPAAPAAPMISAANRSAWERIGGPGPWPGGALALVGPPGAGKTTLARAWAQAARASPLSPTASQTDALAAFTAGAGAVWCDDADRGLDDESLFLLLDLARAQAGAVLLTGTAAPRDWPSRSADLASRLAGLPVARLEEPDEALLEALLRTAVRARFLELSAEAAAYLAVRMERTGRAVEPLAVALDTGLADRRRAITPGAARRAIRDADPVLAAAMGLMGGDALNEPDHLEGAA
jgi:chromosomal replication initiation ATPase DnaA